MPPPCQTGSREHKPAVPALLKFSTSIQGSSLKSNCLRNSHSDEWSKGAVRAWDWGPDRPGALWGDVCAGVWSRWHQRGSAGGRRGPCTVGGAPVLGLQGRGVRVSSRRCQGLGFNLNPSRVLSNKVTRSCLQLLRCVFCVWREPRGAAG